MSTASRRADSRDLTTVHRLRSRLIQVTAAGALVGCLYGGFALAPAVASLTSAHVAPTSHTIAAVSPDSNCGGVPIGC
jgi:hypothetical protein